MRLEAAGMCFDSKVVFSDVSAVFPAGELTCLAGPSGSGKSTLLACIAGYQRLSSGRIIRETLSTDEPTVAGGATASCESPSTARPATLVSWVSQTANLLGARSVLDNVLIGPLSDGLDLPAAGQRAAAALDLVGLREQAEAPARVLSGGEAQRVSFARALASSRPLILADEPSASLDAANTEVIAELLHEIRSVATVIMATHDPMLMKAAQSIVHLR